ncbi:MAG: phosphotransferase family protein [Planctomycetota bacterium]
MNVIKRLPSERFPAILASTDQATLEQWIDGEIIGDSLTDRTVLPACGELLGVIHNTTPPDSVPESVSSSLQEYERWLIEGLAHLTAIESIDAEFARRVEHAALASKPNSAAVGLIHRDFCGDNLVISERLVRSIDNTSFAVGPFDADLARTWYRWPMPAELWNAFLEGYAQQRDSSSFREYGNFWKASVLIRAALMRIRSGLNDQAMIPLGRLHELFS